MIAIIFTVVFVTYGAILEETPELYAMTDNETGVQYVSDGKGGMQVRIDAEGFPVIDREGD